MADRSLESLRIRLVAAGISPRYARRLATELEAHWHDLASDMQQRSVAPNEASTLARKRLGTDEDIAACVLATGRFRSFGRRWPWFVFLLGPVLAFPVLGVAMLILLGLFLIVLPLEFGWLTMDQAMQLWLLGFVCMLPAVIGAIAVSTVVYARRRLCSMSWTFAGIALLSVIAGLMRLEFGPATDTLPGTIGTATFYRLLLPSLPLAVFALSWLITHRINPRAHHHDLLHGN